MIRTENVHYEYGDVKVLDSINIHIQKKKFVGIVGPNGSGKSTLLKCIYRVLKPSMGIVKLDDENIAHMKISETAQKMSVVAQHNYHSFDFVVEDMVLMGRSPYKRALERNNANDYKIVNEALNVVGMSAFKDREFASLSGGEQQRIILARALTQEPECLVLDEPTNHLDIMHQLHLLNIIKGLDISVVAAIHDLNIAMKYCDEVYVIKDGKIICYGETREVLNEEIIRDVFMVDSRIYDYEDGAHIVFKGPVIEDE